MDDKKCFQNLSALFQSHEMTHQPTRRPGHQVSTNKGWAQCLDDGDWSQKSGPSDLISGVLERVWLWAWCGYKANSRIRSLCLLFMRVSGPAARELWALLEINWICEEPRSQCRWGRHNEPGSNRQPFLSSNKTPRNICRGFISCDIQGFAVFSFICLKNRHMCLFSLSRSSYSVNNRTTFIPSFQTVPY